MLPMSSFPNGREDELTQNVKRKESETNIIFLSEIFCKSCNVLSDPVTDVKRPLNIYYYFNETFKSIPKNCKFYLKKKLESKPSNSRIL